MMHAPDAPRLATLAFPFSRGSAGAELGDEGAAMIEWLLALIGRCAIRRRYAFVPVIARRTRPRRTNRA